jgi:hypothetical protein
MCGEPSFIQQTHNNGTPVAHEVHFYQLGITKLSNSHNTRTKHSSPPINTPTHLPRESVCGCRHTKQLEQEWILQWSK